MDSNSTLVMREYLVSAQLKLFPDSKHASFSITPLPRSVLIYTHPWRDNTRLIQRAGGEHSLNPSAAPAAAILRWLVVLHVSHLNKLVVTAL